MTTWEEVQNDPKYSKVLDRGWVGLIDHMGSDSAIVQAARVSYGSGTKTLREDRALIRYLMRARHTSPFEMCSVKFHIKLPIFVFNQLVRHRTASLNAYSGRYSVMTDEFYVPEIEQIKTQSVTNKQGRADPVSVSDALAVQELMRSSSHDNYNLYQKLLGDKIEDCSDLSNEFEGVARESARAILPLNNYTEIIWYQNLHNLLHMLKLRLDEHAQWEIRQYANAIYNIIRSLFPIATEAFEDYTNQSIIMSRMERELMRELIDHNQNSKCSLNEKLTELVNGKGGKKEFCIQRGISERELNDFLKIWNLQIL